MQSNHGKHFEAKEKNQEHFYSFLEQCEFNDKPEPDYKMPSRVEKKLERCPICPSWSFMSKTEMQNHKRLFHPKSKDWTLPQTKTQTKSSKWYKCNFKEKEGEICGAHFRTYHQLKKHKDMAGHKNAAKKQLKNVPRIDDLFRQKLNSVEEQEAEEETDSVNKEHREQRNDYDEEVCGVCGMEDPQSGDYED